MLETKRLRYFVQIAQDGSLSKAAETLQIAQPALSRQLQLLEDYLGFALFVRTGRGMKITREGVLLLNSVAGPLREIELSVDNMRAFAGWIEMPIALGLPPDLAPILAQPLMQAFETELPKAKLRLLQAPSEVLAQWLQRDSLDFAVLDFSTLDEFGSEQLLCRPQLALLGKPDQIQSLVTAVDIDGLPDLPLIVPGSHYGVRKALDLAASSALKPLNFVFESDILDLNLSLVNSGRGFMVLPMAVAKRLAEQQTLAVQELTGSSLQLATYLAKNNNSAVGGIVAVAAI